MRLPLILPPVAIVLLVVAAVALWPAPRPSLPLACQPSALPNPQKGDPAALDPSDRLFLDTAGCVAPFSPDEAKLWWAGWRDRVADRKGKAAGSRRLRGTDVHACVGRAGNRSPVELRCLERPIGGALAKT